MALAITLDEGSMNAEERALAHTADRGNTMISART